MSEQKYKVGAGKETETKGECERPTICPQCNESIIQLRSGENYCEECGWPDENREHQTMPMHYVDELVIEKDRLQRENEELRKELGRLAERFSTTPENAVVVALTFSTSVDGVLTTLREELVKTKKHLADANRGAERQQKVNMIHCDTINTLRTQLEQCGRIVCQDCGVELVPISRCSACLWRAFEKARQTLADIKKVK